MHVWDYKIADKKDLSVLWKLERLINYGVDGEKINAKDLKDNWDKLKIDPNKRDFLKLLLWPKKF